ncbi:MAG TPA: T9SS type B sorting domain-containing protein [Paludibacteraceae bacterium]|nr:T9SS type B sorting domain-containing protein [Paludibacteraceae bacterium]HOU68230.1 T9SS type B sorting domain-containing protein [Paludibacteraceae bacterium]HPH62874.1 T9SS type B sorting domain-containing protein [Paludibacteraceae bacterium]HQF50103.1 T9SS type B sorting domain-containing protein [Paludibacteraceae bacterium]
MKYILHTLGLAVFFLLSLSGVDAQDMKWREIFKEDFGGNNVNDPRIGPALPNEVLGSSIAYTKYWQSSGYCPVKYSSDNPDWHKGSDHTFLNDTTKGYYVRINPVSSQDTISLYAQKITGICPGVTFRFSAWMANLLTNTAGHSGLSLPVLRIGIYEDKEATTLISGSAKKSLNVPLCDDNNSESLDWNELSLEFKTESNSGIAYFIVAAEAPEQGGFDFAIDDIKIDVLQPNITIKNTEFVYGEPVTFTASFVNNGFFADLMNVKYKWQKSTDNGVTFADISGSENYYSADNKCSFTIPSFDKEKDNGIYRVIIGEDGNLGKPICSIQEDIKVNETKNKMNVYLCEHEVRTVEGVTLKADNMNDGQMISAGTEFTLVIHIIKPTLEIGSDTLVCVGSIIDGVAYETIGTFVINDTISSKNSGCDSIIRSNTIKVTGPTIETKAKKNLCDGDSFDGKTYDTVGDYTVETEDGCIKYIQPITVNPKYELNFTLSLCQGAQYNGKTYNTGGTYNESWPLTTTAGCDSIVNATVNVTEKIYSAPDTIEICEGSDTFTFQGQDYFAAGVYNLTSTTTSLASGCDSVSTTHLIINAKFSNRNNPKDTLICYDSQLFGTIYPEPTTTPILVRDPQVYKTKTGCDSVVYYNVTVLKIQLKLRIKSERNTVCKGEEVEVYIKDLKPSNTPLQWTPDLGGTNTKRKNFTPDSSFVCVVKARNDIAQCETTDTVKIKVRESPTITIDSLNEKENVVQYSVTGGTPKYTIFLDKNEIGNSETGEVRNSAIGNHRLIVRDSNNCTDNKIFAINPIPITPSGVFTPNGDGINDTWQIENIDVYPKSTVNIYDRDGKLLAEYKGYDNDNGWDGTYNGKLLPSCDYWYEIILVEADRQYVGHFTLVRN